MKKRYWVLFYALSLNGIAHADSLKGGYPACLSEDLYGQFGMAVANKDNNALQYLMKHGCVASTKAGLKVSVLHTTWTGLVNVRIYDRDDVFEMWTPFENIISK